MLFLLSAVIILCLWHFAWVKLVSFVCVCVVELCYELAEWVMLQSQIVTAPTATTHSLFIHTHALSTQMHSEHTRTRLEHTFSPLIWWMWTSLCLCSTAAITHIETHSVHLSNECSCRALWNLCSHHLKEQLGLLLRSIFFISIVWNTLFEL